MAPEKKPAKIYTQITTKSISKQSTWEILKYGNIFYSTIVIKECVIISNSEDAPYLFYILWCLGNVNCYLQKDLFELNKIWSVECDITFMETLNCVILGLENDTKMYNNSINNKLEGASNHNVSYSMKYRSQSYVFWEVFLILPAT